MTRTRMMDGMGTPPRMVGCQCEHTDHPTDPIIRQAMAEERAVTAIMLDHEETYQKPCSGQRKNQREPVAKSQANPHHYPQRDKGSGGDCKFKDTASMVRLTVGREDLCPFAGSEPVQSFSLFHQKLFPRCALIAVWLKILAPPRWLPDGTVRCSMGHIAAEAVRASGALTIARAGQS